MPNAGKPLFSALLRTVADWADGRWKGAQSRPGRTERRRRARQRLKDRAVLAEFFRDRTQDLGAEVTGLQELVADLKAERDRLRQQITLHHELMDDLGRRNAFLADQCTLAHHEAEHWKRFVEDERRREVEFGRMLHLN